MFDSSTDAVGCLLAPIGAKSSKCQPGLAVRCMHAGANGILDLAVTGVIRGDARRVDRGKRSDVGVEGFPEHLSGWAVSAAAIGVVLVTTWTRVDVWLAGRKERRCTQSRPVDRTACYERKV